MGQKKNRKKKLVNRFHVAEQNIEKRLVNRFRFVAIRFITCEICYVMFFLKAGVQLQINRNMLGCS